jgi:hypothetical protein
VNDIRLKLLNQPDQSREGQRINGSASAERRDRNRECVINEILSGSFLKRRRILDRIERRDFDLNAFARESLRQHAQLMRGIGAIQRIDDVQYAAHERKTSLSS